MHRIINWVSLVFLHFLRISLQHSRKFSVLFLLVVIFLASRLPLIQTELRIFDISDPKFTSTEQLREMKKDFDDRNSILFLFSNDQGQSLTSEQACHIRDWLSAIRNPSSPLGSEITSVLNPFLLKKPRLKGTAVEWTELLEPPRCDQTPYSLQALKDSPWGGMLTDREARDLAVEVRFRDTPGGSRYGKFDPTPIGALWKDLRENLENKTDHLHAYLGGRSSFQWFYKEALHKDLFINVCVLLVFLILFRLFYGTWKSGLLLVGIIGTAAIVIFGAMSLYGDPIDYLSNGLFLMMCVSAVEDFVFISHHQLSHSRAGWRGSIRFLLMPGFFTSLTTFAGFLSLQTADFSIVRRFGFWAAAAAMGEWLMTFYALPILMQAFKIRGKWVNPEKAHFKSWVQAISKIRLPQTAIVSSLALFFASIWGFGHLNFNDSPRNNFAKSHMQHQMYDYLRNSRGWESPIFLIFPNADLRQKNEAVLHDLKKDINVEKIENPYETVDWFLNGFDLGYQRWIKAELSLSSTYRGFFSRSDSVRAPLYLKSFDLKDINETIGKVNEACLENGCYAAGEGVVFAEYSNQVLNTLFKSFISSLVLVGVILLLLALAMKVPHKWGLLFSVFWSPVLIIGGLALFQVPMNFTTSMFAAVLVGLTGDNAVQYLFASKRGDLQKGIQKRSGASVQITCIAGAASLFFLGFTLVPLKTLGILFSLGFVISLVGDLWVLNRITEPRS